MVVTVPAGAFTTQLSGVGNATGEALISLLDAKGAPGPTQRAWMFAPGSQIGPITPEERRALIANSVVAGVYEKEVDRESALEMLKARAETKAAAAPATAGSAAGAGAGAGGVLGGLGGSLGGMVFGSTGPRGGHHDGLVDLMAKSAARSAGSAISRSILRGVLGSIMGKR